MDTNPNENFMEDHDGEDILYHLRTRKLRELGQIAANNIEREIRRFAAK